MLTDLVVPAGPRYRFSELQLPATYQPYRSRIASQDSFEDFQAYIRANFRDVTPGGFYLGDNATASPLMSYRIDGNLGYAALAKNLIDSILLNTTIQADFSTFALPFIPSIGDSLQLVLYFGFAMCVFPAFFALYPTFERLGNIRALHYSNGMRPASLWLSYILFDTTFVVLISIVTVVLFTSVSFCSSKVIEADPCSLLMSGMHLAISSSYFGSSASLPLCSHISFLSSRRHSSRLSHSLLADKRCSFWYTS